MTSVSTAAIADEATDGAAHERRARRIVVFRVDGRSYALEIDTVSEIIPWRKATRLPGAPPWVAGLINVRGSILTVIDLGVRLGGQPTGHEFASVLMADYEGKRVGLAVDEVLDVHDMSTETEAAGADVRPDGPVRALLQLEEQVIVLLDIEALIRQVLI
ncbi:MAG TPA: chemotaxis protein CheW [Gemmatimonadaceae bacterium]|nr:chemotaxis protein CheW [Gemmatimonadaceae bacterium]